MKLINQCRDDRGRGIGGENEDPQIGNTRGRRKRKVVAQSVQELLPVGEPSLRHELRIVTRAERPKSMASPSREPTFSTNQDLDRGSGFDPFEVGSGDDAPGQRLFARQSNCRVEVPSFGFDAFRRTRRGGRSPSVEGGGGIHHPSEDVASETRRSGEPCVIVTGSQHADRQSGLERAIDRHAGSVEIARGSDANCGLREELETNRCRSTRCFTPKRSCTFDKWVDLDRSFELQHRNPFRTV
jgi:hypothetical protein